MSGDLQVRAFVAKPPFGRSAPDLRLQLLIRPVFSGRLRD